MSNFPEHVSAVSPLNGALDGSKPRRRSPRTQAALNGEVETLKVEEGCWQLALDIRDRFYDGDPRAVHIVDEFTVEITNEHLYGKGRR
jgi:hypothetical protein